VVPKVALAPIFVTWFGFGLTSKVVMAATISFFPTLVNTIVGLGSVEEEAVLLFRSLVAGRHQAFFKLSLPMIETYNFQLDIPAVFALIVVLSVVGLGLYLAFEYIDRKIVFWRDVDMKF
jgi:NitT/TauT family transport system permease protein